MKDMLRKYKENFHFFHIFFNIFFIFSPYSFRLFSSYFLTKSHWRRRREGVYSRISIRSPESRAEIISPGQFFESYSPEYDVINGGGGYYRIYNSRPGFEKKGALHKDWNLLKQLRWLRNTGKMYMIEIQWPQLALLLAHFHSTSSLAVCLLPLYSWYFPSSITTSTLPLPHPDSLSLSLPRHFTQIPKSRLLLIHTFSTSSLLKPPPAGFSTSYSSISLSLLPVKLSFNPSLQDTNYSYFTLIFTHI